MKNILRILVGPFLFMSVICLSQTATAQGAKVQSDGKIYLQAKDAELLSGSTKIYVVRGSLATSIYEKGVEYKRDFAAIESMAKKIIENGAAVFSSPLSLSKATLVYDGQDRDNVECYRSGDFRKPKDANSKMQLSTSDLCFILPNLAE